MCPILRIQGNINPGNKRDLPRLIQESLRRPQRTLGIASKSHMCKTKAAYSCLRSQVAKTLEVRKNSSDMAREKSQERTRR